jgi:hypothetical protein
LPEIHEKSFLAGLSPIGWKYGGTAAGREYPIGCLAWGSLPAADISWYRKPHTHQVWGLQDLCKHTQYCVYISNLKELAKLCKF